MHTKLAQAGVLALASVLIVGASAGSAAAQFQTQSCGSQRSMEQLMETEGSLTPDDCRAVTLTRLERADGDLCMLDFSGTDAGVVDDLLAVTRTEQWWIACESLSQGAEQR